MKTPLLLVLSLCCVTATSSAQEAIPAPLSPAPVQDEGPRKSGLAAFGLSLGGTALGVASTVLAVGVLGGNNTNVGASVVFSVLGLSFLTVGPSFGHIYSGAQKHAVILTGARLLSFGVPFILDQRAIAKGNLNAGILSGVGGFVFGSLALYDTIDAPFSVRRLKKKEARADFHLMPTMLPRVGGGFTTGAAAVLTF